MLLPTCWNSMDQTDLELLQIEETKSFMSKTWASVS